MQTPFPTDEERQAHAAKAAKRRERNRREKEKKRERKMRQEEEQEEAAAANRAAAGVAGDGDGLDPLAGSARAGLEVSNTREESRFAARSGALLDAGASLSLSRCFLR